ncbi:uncharacterized protein LOC114063754 isoform X2 [Empidonax traillii]|uniref:uncharacterized protein LOC114063754 isoform X2 n=1 Tax=Empidonax traillii TaxID=164674 RepID=UPI000FFD7779|nr:uncharacterized protein LOC114063754 isoform X2 [Empidonax traillii]
MPPFLFFFFSFFFFLPQPCSVIKLPQDGEEKGAGNEIGLRKKSHCSSCSQWCLLPDVRRFLGSLSLKGGIQIFGDKSCILSDHFLYLTWQQASCGKKSTRWMLNWTFLLSGMKGCYLSRAKRELRCRGRGRKSSKLARHVADLWLKSGAVTEEKLPGFICLWFKRRVKWVNIRQLIIETSMLHSQSRMTEQVMESWMLKETLIRLL